MRGRRHGASFDQAVVSISGDTVSGPSRAMRAETSALPLMQPLMGMLGTMPCMLPARPWRTAVASLPGRKTGQEDGLELVKPNGSPTCKPTCTGTCIPRCVRCGLPTGKVRVTQDGMTRYSLVSLTGARLTVLIHAAILGHSTCSPRRAAMGARCDAHLGNCWCRAHGLRNCSRAVPIHGLPNSWKTIRRQASLLVGRLLRRASAQECDRSSVVLACSRSGRLGSHRSGVALRKCEHQLSGLLGTTLGRPLNCHLVVPVVPSLGHRVPQSCACTIYGLLTARRSAKAGSCRWRNNSDLLVRSMPSLLVCCPAVSPSVTLPALLSGLQPGVGGDLSAYLAAAFWPERLTCYRGAQSGDRVSGSMSCRLYDHSVCTGEGRLAAMGTGGSFGLGST